MQMTINEIFDAVMKLPEDLRLELVDRLMDALSPEGIMSVDDPGFRDELERRFNDGTEEIPWSDVREKN
jgi:putative addiction module component (TIGR02574 family)